MKYPKRNPCVVTVPLVLQLTMSSCNFSSQEMDHFWMLTFCVLSCLPSDHRAVGWWEVWGRMWRAASGRGGGSRLLRLTTAHTHWWQPRSQVRHDYCQLSCYIRGGMISNRSPRLDCIYKPGLCSYKSASSPSGHPSDVVPLSSACVGLIYTAFVCPIMNLLYITIRSQHFLVDIC